MPKRRPKVPTTDSRQLELKALTKTGKPIVLVTMNGRPLTLPWENENIPAILVSWFGGAEAGHAIADLLFGERVPCGKLTTTWPRHVGQVPLSYYHANTGRPGNPAEDPGKYTTRCYLDGSSKPLFPFGFGLSYTSFTYGPVTADKTVAVDDDTVTVSVTVTNTGTRAGHEIVQMYVTDPVASMVRPVKLLRGFGKIGLQPGEQRVVTFTITPRDLEFHDNQLRRIWEPGKFIIGIGPNSDELETVEVRWTKRQATGK